eukprot:2985234-Rhodomonas_salina.1
MRQNRGMQDKKKRADQVAVGEEDEAVEGFASDAKELLGRTRGSQARERAREVLRGLLGVFSLVGGG